MFPLSAEVKSLRASDLARLLGTAILCSKFFRGLTAGVIRGWVPVKVNPLGREI
jgi:hypothetical protein